MHPYRSNALSTSALSVLFTVACASSALADTWTVDDDGPADFSTIQAAVDAAAAGDTLLVASGLYPEDVLVSKSLDILGETPQRPVLSGVSDDPAPTLRVAGAVGHVRVESFVLASEDPDCSIDPGRVLECLDGADVALSGVHLQGGSCGSECGSITEGLQVYVENSRLWAVYGSSLRTFRGEGGSLYARDSVVLVHQYQFREDARCASTAPSPGAAIYSESSELTVRHTTFDQIEVQQARGTVYVDGGQAQLENCQFDRCGGTQNAAGALFATNGAQVELLESRFEGCRSSGWSAPGVGWNFGCGGAVWIEDGTLLAQSCEFIDNHARKSRGGAVFLGPAWIVDGDIPVPAEFVECLFEGNRTGNDGTWSGGKGGAVYGKDDTVFQECTFIRNRAVSVGGPPEIPTHGGAIFSAGQVTDCTFRSNRASEGAAIFLSSGTTPCLIEGSTFDANRALNTGAITLTSLNGALIRDNTMIWNRAGGDPLDGRTAGAVSILGEFPVVELESNRFLCNLPKHTSPGCTLLGGNSFSHVCGQVRIWYDGPQDFWWTIGWRNGQVHGLIEQPLELPLEAERDLGADGFVYVAELDAGRVSRWDPESGKFMGDLIDPDLGIAPAAVGFSDGQAVVLDGEGVLYLLDPDTGDVQSVLKGGSPSATDLDVGPDALAYVLAQGWNDEPVVEVWDLELGQIVSTLATDNLWLEVPGDVTALPDGRVLVSDEGASQIHQFDAVNGTYLGLFLDKDQSADLGLGSLRDVALAPDGSLYLACESGIHVFDAEGTYRKPLLANGAPALATKLVFLPSQGSPDVPMGK